MSEYLDKFAFGTIENEKEGGEPLILIYMTDKLSEEMTGPDAEEWTEEAVVATKAWCKEHRVYYYGKPHDCIDMFEAVKLANEANCIALIVDDLS